LPGTLGIDFATAIRTWIPEMPRRHAHEGVRPAAIAKPARLWLAYVVVLAAALTFFVISMAPGVLWQDSGMAQVRVLQRDLVGHLGLALSHPLYYVLAIALQLLPLGESAFKTNLVSALFGAVTVANVFLLLQLVTGQRAAAVIGALSLAVAHTFWQHCSVAEVYTVSTALLSAELLSIRQYAVTGQPRWLLLLFLLNGLGVSNHMLAVLSLACYVALAAWLFLGHRPPACGLRPAVVPLLALAWVAGAGLYLALIVAQIIGGEAPGAAVYSALFGTGYADHVLKLLPGPEQLINSVLYLGLNFPTPAVLLVIPGLAAVWRMRFKTLGVMIIALLAVHLVWAVRYDVPDQYTFFIPSLVLLAVITGCGAARFLEGRSARWRAVLIVAAAFPAVVYVPLPRMARAAGLRLGLSRTVPYRDEYAYFLHPWKTGYRGAERFACGLGEMLPESAVLIADGTTVRPIHYLQQLGHWRRDVEVFPALDRPTEATRELSEQRLAGALAAGRVFVVTPQRGYCPSWLLERYEFVRDGPVYRVVGRKGTEHNATRPEDAP
jgi:hypothetical protein